MSCGAVILAGGQSSRMGQDKAFVTFGGKSLLQRQIETLRAAGFAEILISGRAGVDYSPFGLPVVLDQALNTGPLAGIHAALVLTKTRRLLVLAVDLPQMTPAFLRLLKAAGGTGAGVIPRLSGQVEPLAAIYPASARQLAEKLVAERKYAVRSFASACVMAGLATYMDCPAKSAALFKNFNTPADL